MTEIQVKRRLEGFYRISTLFMGTDLNAKCAIRKCFMDELRFATYKGLKP